MPPRRHPRDRQPADPHAETAAALGSEYEIDDRWIELDYGDLDQMPLRDVPPAVWAQWRADPTFVPAGGESLAALGVRVREACSELLDEIREANVAVVTHVSPIKAAIAWALGAGDDLAWRTLRGGGVDRADRCRSVRDDGAVTERASTEVETDLSADFPDSRPPFTSLEHDLPMLDACIGSNGVSRG